MTDIARQYALAVFGLAKENNLVESLKTDFAVFLASYNEETRLFFQHPAFRKGEKKEIISHLEILDTLKNFLYLLIDNDRMDSLFEIHDALNDIIMNQNMLLRVQVISKTSLSKTQLERIKIKLENDYHRSVEIEEIQDESMIAGYKLLFEGSVYDETIERKLIDLRTNLKKN